MQTPNGLVVPEDWLVHHKHIFGSSKQVVVTPTSPLLLTQVYATALSLDAYDMATTHDLYLERLFCDKKRILRQGSVYSADLYSADLANGNPPHGNCRLEFRIDMLEPVLQGYAEAGTTSFILTCLEAEVEAEDESEPLALSSDDESIEIDEEFLANSIVYPSYNPIAPSYDWKRSEEDEVVSELLFQAQPLSSPISTLQDDHTLYLRTADLGRLGVLSGDWVSNGKSPIVLC